jgi:hypothetical protein
MMESCSVTQAKRLSDLFPHASKDALDLLSKLMQVCAGVSGHRAAGQSDSMIGTLYNRRQYGYHVDVCGPFMSMQLLTGAASSPRSCTS